MISNTDIVLCAREWLNTPFHHQARLKGVGVDCVGLIIGVAKELNLIEKDFNITAYPRVPDGTSLMYLTDLHLIALPNNTPYTIGNIIVVRFGQNPQHLGIIGDYRHGGYSIIHASSNSGKVIETRLMFSASMHFVKAFKMPGV